MAEVNTNRQACASGNRLPWIYATSPSDALSLKIVRRHRCVHVHHAKLEVPTPGDEATSITPGAALNVVRVEGTPGGEPRQKKKYMYILQRYAYYDKSALQASTPYEGLHSRGWASLPGRGLGTPCIYPECASQRP